jgi:hypothetical protein
MTPQRCGYNVAMFFRRERPNEITFSERLDALRKAGFTVESQGAGPVTVSRDRCAAVVEDVPGAPPRIGKAGVVRGGGIAFLVDGGFQKFFRTPSGKRVPALAADLKTLHAFEEDLRDAVGVVSLYNESLGTTCDYHVYDRLEGRE